MLNKINAIEQKINNGKKLIANAITDKGVTTPVDSTLETMANNINSITGGGGLEPGSMIPVDMLEPPKETTITKGYSDLSPICVVDTYDYIYYSSGGSSELFRFDKTTKKSEQYSLFGNPYVTYFKKFGDRIFWVSTTFSVIIITDLQLNKIHEINIKSDAGLSKLSTPFRVEEIDNYYVVINGSHSASNEYIITINKETAEINSKKITDIYSSAKVYHHGLLTHNNYIYMLGQRDLICVDSNLDFISGSTTIQAVATSQNDNFVMYVHNEYLYILEKTSLDNVVKKVNLQTLEYESIQYKNPYTNDKILHADDDYVYVYSNSYYKLKIFSRNFDYVTELYLQDLRFINRIDDKLIIQDNLDIVLIDINDNFNTIFSIKYSNNFRNSSNNYISSYDFDNVQKMCYIFDDKIYMFRCIVSYIDLEPKYTVKAQALAELPAVLSYIAKCL